MWCSPVFESSCILVTNIAVAWIRNVFYVWLHVPEARGRRVSAWGSTVGSRDLPRDTAMRAVGGGEADRKSFPVW